MRKENAMQIEEGKWYLDRTGELHGPAVRDTNDPDDFYQWKLGRADYLKNGKTRVTSFRE